MCLSALLKTQQIMFNQMTDCWKLPEEIIYLSVAPDARNQRTNTLLLFHKTDFDLQTFEGMSYLKRICARIQFLQV